MDRVDIRKKLDNNIAKFRQMFLCIIHREGNYDRKKLLEAILQLENAILSIKRENKTDLRECTYIYIKKDIKELKEILLPLQKIEDLLNKPSLWVKSVTVYQSVFDGCNFVSELLERKCRESREEK